MSLDMSKYLGLFVSEATEHLEALAQDLVALEKNPGPQTIDSMFRHAHSVKGMAASMGFEAIAVVAHRIEDLVDAVRSEPEKLTRDLVDLILGATDVLLGFVRAALDGGPTQDAGPLLAQLNDRVIALQGGPVQATRVAEDVTVHRASPDAGGAGGLEGVASPADASSPAPPEPAPAAKSDSGLGLPPRFAVKVRVQPTSQAPGVRGFLVHKKLSGLGNVFDLRPALEDIRAGRIPDGLISLEVETSVGEEGLAQALRNVSEVDTVSIKAVQQQAVPPMPPPPAAGPEGPKIVGQEPARTVRVKTELLDYFLDTVGEMLLATARIREVGKVLPSSARPVLEESVYRLHALVKDLHDKVMSVRMTPISVITDRLPRAARDIARKRDRDVDLVITGAEIELDRAIIDDLSDPLLHILRNCIDHGLESPEARVAAKKSPKGKVQVSVRRGRDRVIVEIEDDGQGMDAGRLKTKALERGLITQEQLTRMTDREAFMLACLPGVSTAKDVTDISGRGVGMDAVKRTVENVGGSLEIESERGRGTRFTLRLPLTVAVVQLLLVQVGNEIVGLPIAKVLGALEAEPDKLSRSRDRALLPYGTTLLPVHSMAELIGVPSDNAARTRPFVVMEGDAGRVALQVDRLLGQEEVVLKALSRPLDLVPGLSGVTILGTGRPIFILDVPRLLAA
ncbi:MAG: chemotaxis protein CheA [Myxococcota bacterium]|nr:chemotaxis protein CheA [Myxococcota bacterium]